MMEVLRETAESLKFGSKEHASNPIYSHGLYRLFLLFMQLWMVKIDNKWEQQPI